MHKDFFLHRNSKIEDYEEEENELEDAISLDKTRRIMSKSTKPTMTGRLTNESRYFGLTQDALDTKSINNDGQPVNLQMYKIDRKLMQAKAKRDNIIKT